MNEFEKPTYDELATALRGIMAQISPISLDDNIPMNWSCEYCGASKRTTDLRPIVHMKLCSWNAAHAVLVRLDEAQKEAR